MKTTQTTLVLAVVLLFSRGASAQPDSKGTVKDVLGEITALLAEKQEIAEGATVALSIRKELNAEKVTLDKEFRQLDSERNDLLSYCSGTYEQAEYERRLSICNQRQPAYDVARTDYNRRTERYNFRNVKLAEAIRGMIARDEMIDARLRVLNGALSQAGRMQGAQCDALATPEAMAQCLMEYWDGARKR